MNAFFFKRNSDEVREWSLNIIYLFMSAILCQSVLKKKLLQNLVKSGGHLKEILAQQLHSEDKHNGSNDLAITFTLHYSEAEYKEWKTVSALWSLAHFTFLPNQYIFF